MGNESNLTTNPIFVRAKASSDASQDKAKTDFETKKAEYEAAMKELNIFQDKAWYAERNLLAKRNDNDYDKYKKEYATVKTGLSGSEIEVDVLRSSVRNRLDTLRHANSSASIFSGLSS